MPAHDFSSTRLFVEGALAAGGAIALAKPQSHYLTQVLRLKTGAELLVFNGRDGEWRARLDLAGKKAAVLTAIARTRAQPAPSDLHYLFAPLKHARLDYMVQKAVEMGASYLQPVLTRHTQVTRVNLERMRANAIEAAEQCGVLAVPEVGEPTQLQSALAALGQERVLVFCDERADVTDPLQSLIGTQDLGTQDLGTQDLPRLSSPLAVLVGPEGGFSAEEREILLQVPRAVRLALGPRILRADTAAVAALALVQAALGDWRGD